MTANAQTSLRKGARRTAERRAAILDAARNCFTSQGYDATGIGDVQRLSGASIGSIYHHFGSKEQLATEVYLSAIQDYQAGFRQAIESAETAEGGIRAGVSHHILWAAANRE